MGARFRRFLSRALLLGGLACLVEVGLIIYAGGEWTKVIRARNPESRLLFAFLFWLGSYVARHAGEHTRRDWARFAGKLVLAGFSSAVTLLAAEVFLRAYLKQVQIRQSIEQLGKRPAPLSEQRIRSGHPLAAITRRSDDPLLVFELQSNVDMEFGHKALHLNSQGMRDSGEYTVERKPNSVRIIGLGDSGIFGWGVNQDEDGLSVLESNLNARADGVLYEVLNMGVPGYNTQLEVQMLKSRGLKYRPDIVVVGWCDNDFQLPFFIPQEGQWNRKDVSFLYYLLFDRPRFADVALSRVHDQRQYDQAKVPEHFRRGTDVEGVRRSMRELKEIAEREGLNVLVIGAMRAEAVEVCKTVGLPYYNTRERIRADEYPVEYYVHAIHPRPGGHRVIAERLEQEFEMRGWLEPRS